MSRMDEREVFTRAFESVDPETLWGALKRTLQTMDIREVDDASRTARFSTGVSLTSWGENMLATVEAAGGGAQLVVRGRPKGKFLTSKVGEDLHARGVEKQLVADLEAQLTAAR